ncbi:DUF3971 domain-containing protein [Notoacmeibacter sp. MSK16QG-6]|uniref:YhdP family protein n=1 Tax=Notoacmeibacter sp. MSK16QG-6 TaxID=2957982 RepID=UPI00209F106C|nr:DUF3971 domain-containing protein [Notoacmeibacter sp. MSK16QG-6]MCP1197838.1 hypothetical protein [Notoacmeibacter sp. MSK16QG-6]
MAVHLRDVALLAPESPVPLASLQTLDLMLSPAALLQGRLSLSSLALEGGRIEAGLLGQSDSIDPLAPIRNDAGQIDPDRATSLVMQSVRFLDRRADDLGLRRIGLKNVTIAHGLLELRVSESSIRRKRDRNSGLTMEAVTAVHNVTETLRYDVAIRADATFDSDRRIKLLKANLDLPDFDLQPSARSRLDMNSVGVELEATEIGAQEPGRLMATVSADHFELTPRPHEPVSGSFSLTVRMGEGSGKAEFDDGFVRIGETHLPLDGAVGPSPLRSDEGTPLYRFELISNGASINAVDTGLPALEGNFLLRGNYDPLLKIASGGRMAINWPGGKAEGWVALAIADPPFLGMSLETDELASVDLKRLWPYTVAPKSRAFVLENLQKGSGRSVKLDVAAPLPQLLDPESRHTKDELKLAMRMDGVSIALPDDLPNIENAAGTIKLEGTTAEILVEHGSGEVGGERLELGSTRLDIPDTKAKPLRSQLSVSATGDGGALARIAQSEPINAPLPIAPERLSGMATANVEADLILGPTLGQPSVSAFAVSAEFENASLDGEYDGHTVADADGTLFVDPTGLTLRLQGKLDDLEASLDLKQARDQPMEFAVRAKLDEKGLNRIAPALTDYMNGTVHAEMTLAPDGVQDVSLDLKDAALAVSPIGWSKGLGVPGKAAFRLETKTDTTRISNFNLQAGATRLEGKMTLRDGGLESADFPVLALNENDDARLSLRRDGKTMRITIRGPRLDARPIVRILTSPASEKPKTSQDGETRLADRVELDALVGTLSGFGEEALRNAKITFSGTSDEPDHAVLSAVFKSGKRVAFTYERQANRKLRIKSGDAGALLRFTDLYGKVSGGRIDALMTGGAAQPMTGTVDLSDFLIVNEPRLESLASRPAGGQSLNQRVNGKLDTQYVAFESGSVSLVKSKNRLDVANGVVRGPQIGMMFEGTVYDAEGRMNMTGTFMPAYGLNRIFGEIPILGMVLGNGRDKGLIGVTYRLSGLAKDPQLTINPLSVVAPGIFRSIFAFR